MFRKPLWCQEIAIGPKLTKYLKLNRNSHAVLRELYHSNSEPFQMKVDWISAQYPYDFMKRIFLVFFPSVRILIENNFFRFSLDFLLGY